MSNRIVLLLPAIVTLLAASAELGDRSGSSNNVIRADFGNQEPRRCDVFVSYCKNDKKYWNRINILLARVHKEYKIYSYDLVEPGSEIREEARSALLDSAVAVLLMSADYINSDLIERELFPLLDQVENYHRYILWLQVGRFDLAGMERLTRYQMVGAGSKPLDRLSGPERDDIYMDLVAAIRRRLEECGRQPSPSSNTPEEM